MNNIATGVETDALSACFNRSIQDGLLLSVCQPLDVEVKRLSLHVLGVLRSTHGSVF